MSEKISVNPLEELILTNLIIEINNNPNKYKSLRTIEDMRAYAKFKSLLLAEALRNNIKKSN